MTYFTRCCQRSGWAKADEATDTISKKKKIFLLIC
jgi:hypothetical protein